jgi:hypothetical protein
LEIELGLNAGEAVARPAGRNACGDAVSFGSRNAAPDGPKVVVFPEPPLKFITPMICR